MRRMAREGAGWPVVPAVTPQICIAQLMKRTPVPLINIVDPIAAELRARKIRRVALFGTTFTMEGSLCGQLAGAEIVKPQPAETPSTRQPYPPLLAPHKPDPRDP